MKALAFVVALMISASASAQSVERKVWTNADLVNSTSRVVKVEDINHARPHVDPEVLAAFKARSERVVHMGGGSFHSGGVVSTGMSASQRLEVQFAKELALARASAPPAVVVYASQPLYPFVSVVYSNRPIYSAPRSAACPLPAARRR